MKILVVEDEPLIAIDLREQLMERGLYDIHLRFGITDALDWLSANRPDVAILDLHLGRVTCDPIALKLNEDRIPYVVCSGDHPRYAGAIFADVPWVSKPCNSEQLVDAVSDLVGSLDEQQH